MIDILHDVMRSGIIMDYNLLFSMTPYELELYYEAYNAQMVRQIQHDNIYYGTLTATILNTMRQKRSDKVFRYTDIFKHPQVTSRDGGDIIAQTPDEIAGKFTQFQKQINQKRGD